MRSARTSRRRSTTSRRQRNDARALADAGTRSQLALQDFAADAYGALVPHRLDGLKIAVLFIGPVDQPVDFSVRKGIRDAGGTVTRVRQLHVPIRDDAIERALVRTPGAPALRGHRPHLRRRTRARHGIRPRRAARRCGTRSSTRLWTSAKGTPRRPPTPSSSSARRRRRGGSTARFLYGLYQGVARAGTPAVGVEKAGVEISAFPVLGRAGLSTVGSVDDEAGRLALVLLLAGAEPGHYGVGDSGTDGRRAADSVRRRHSERRAPHRPRCGTRRGGADRRHRAQPAGPVAGCRDRRRRRRLARRHGSRRRERRRDEWCACNGAAKGRRSHSPSAKPLPGRCCCATPTLRGDLRPLLGSDADLAIAVFTRREGGGVGLAKGTARALIRPRGGFDEREPLSGQRGLSGRARATLFPVAAGFGVETRMTIDACACGPRRRGGRTRPRAPPDRT